MARPIHKLSAKQVERAGPGYHSDGGGLYLVVGKTTNAASWAFRYAIGKAKHELGLGSATAFSLAEARERARERRKLLADGIDPLGSHRAAREAVAVQSAGELRTWGEAVDAFLEQHAPAWKSPKQEPQWRAGLTAYGPAASMPVRRIDTALVAELMQKGWTTKTETFTRVRAMIERIWNAEKVHGHVSGENPARWKGIISQSPPKDQKTP